MRVTSVEKWRGMESEVLLWLVDGGYYTGSMMDSCTKVTVKMVGRVLVVEDTRWGKS